MDIRKLEWLIVTSLYLVHLHRQLKMKMGEDNYHIVGEVKNDSPADSMNNIKIISTFHDNAGKAVGTDFAYTYIDMLRRREKSSFEIILNNATQSQKVSS